MKPSAVALNVLAVFYQGILKKPSISVARTVIIIIRYSANPVNNYIRTNPPVMQKERSMVSDSTKQKRPARHTAFCGYLMYSPRVQGLDNNNIQSSPLLRMNLLRSDPSPRFPLGKEWAKKQKISIDQSITVNNP